MNKEEKEKFKKLLTDTSNAKLFIFTEEEIAADPTNKGRTKFLLETRDDPFFQEFFLRGFLSGLDFVK